MLNMSIGGMLGLEPVTSSVLRDQMTDEMISYLLKIDSTFWRTGKHLTVRLWRSKRKPYLRDFHLLSPSYTRSTALHSPTFIPLIITLLVAGQALMKSFIVKHIGKNQSCTELNLGGQRFGLSAFQKLIFSVQKCGSISKLNLSECAKELEPIPVASWATDFMLSAGSDNDSLANIFLLIERQTQMTKAVERMLRVSSELSKN